MAYNKRNLLKKIVEIQNITLEYKKKGVSQKYIFNNFIKDRFCISQRTYDSYLSINAKKMLKEFEGIN